MRHLKSVGLVAFMFSFIILGGITHKAMARLTGVNPNGAQSDIWCTGPVGAETCVDYLGDVIPTTTDDTDLGTSSLEWNNAYIKNLVISGGTTSGSQIINGSLTVSGAAGIGGATLANGTLIIKSTSSTNGNPVLNVQNNSGTSIAVVTQAGNVGIGGAPQGKLDVFTDSTHVIQFSNSELAGNGQYLFFQGYTGNTPFIQTRLVGSDVISLSLQPSGGRIGIHDLTPDADLDIISAAAPTGFILSISSQSDVTGNIVSVLGNGNVGIGQATPVVPLDVVSTTQGLGIPSLTTAQVQASTPGRAGTLIYNSTLSQVCVSTGTTLQGYGRVSNAATCQ